MRKGLQLYRVSYRSHTVEEGHAILMHSQRGSFSVFNGTMWSRNLFVIVNHELNSLKFVRRKLMMSTVYVSQC